MTLAEWVALEKKEGRAKSTRGALKALSDKIRSAGGETVSLLTLQGVEKGQRLSLHRKMKAIEVATDGQVTVSELS